MVLLGGLVALGMVRHTVTLSTINTQTEYLYFAPGEGLAQIAAKAKGAGVVRQAWHFTVAARALGKERNLQAGEYEIAPADTLAELIRQIAGGYVFYRKIAIPEGLSVAQIETLLIGAPGLLWDGYKTPVEGSLLPETYYYTRGEQASVLVERMKNKMGAIVDRLWEERAAGLPLKSKQEAIILASIVEKETGKAAERPMVAAVFINRLKRRMRLQSDPTVVYGITEGMPLGRRLTSIDLQETTLYNTYRIAGLPPAPIANPGLESLRAVLNPSDVKYLYFVADGTGGHAFAKTLKEHNRNVARWRRIRDAQG